MSARGWRWLGLSGAVCCLMLSVPADAARKGAVPAKAPATSARARPFRKKVTAILPFEGPFGAPARAALMVGLGKRPELTLVPTGQTDTALKLLNPSPSTPADFQGTAKALDAAAILQGAANKKVVIVRVYSGDSGALVDQQTFQLKNGKLKPFATLAWFKLKKALMQTRVPAANAPPPVVTPPPTGSSEPVVTAPPSVTETPPTKKRVTQRTPSTEPPPENTAPVVVAAEPEKPAEPASPADEVKPLWLDAQVFGGVFRRSLTYTDDVFKTLSTYQLNGAPTIGGAVEVYPLGPFMHGPITGIGLIGAYQTAVGLKSVTSDGAQTFTTRADNFDVGAKYRYAFGLSDVGLSIAYGGQDFSFTAAAGGAAPPVPSVAYRYLLFDLTGRLALGTHFALFGGLGYSPVFASGEISSTAYFPHLTVGAVQADVGFAWAFLPMFEARISGNYRHYFYSMNPAVGDANVAGGALDQYITGTISLAARLR